MKNVNTDDYHLLQQLQHAAQKIIRFTSGFKNQHQLAAHEIARDAVIMNLIVLRELEHKLSPASKASLTEIDWSEFGFLEKRAGSIELGLDSEVIWCIASTRVPRLLEKLNGILPIV